LQRITTIICLFLPLWVLTCNNNLAAQSDLSATCKTQSLFQQLKNLSNDHLLFGHQNTTFEGIGWEDKGGFEDRSDCLKSVGDYPAVYGFDFIRGFVFERHAIRANERGAIVTFSDHMVNFRNNGDSWNTSGNTVREILTENTATRSKFILHLNQVANFIKGLKDKNGDFIPVIYRPFHENTGDWFWWSKEFCTPEEYVALWRFTVDYLRNDREVHNVLYAYSPSDPAFLGGYESRYPGNEYVDIVGFDSYATIAYPMFLIANAQLVVEFAEAHDKVAALTEFGVNGGIQFADETDWFTNTFLATLKNDPIARKLAYAHTWRNDRLNHHWVPLPEDKNHADFVAFYQDDFTVFEKDLPDLYDCSLATSATEYQKHLADKMAIRISPNPVTDVLSIQSTTTKPENTLRLAIYNSIGQLMLKKDNYIIGNQLIISNLEKGIYFLKLMDVKEKRIMSTSFVKY